MGIVKRSRATLKTVERPFVSSELFPWPDNRDFENMSDVIMNYEMAPVTFGALDSYH